MNRTRLLRNAIKLLWLRSAKNLLRRDRLRLYWHQPKEPNWGDSASPLLFHYLTGREIEYCKCRDPYKLVGMGSIMAGANSRSEVWGAGVIRPGDTGQSPPRKIHAVRGPLTRCELLRKGIRCPKVYGDPALLWPLFHPCSTEKRFDLTVIPHYREMELPSVRRLDGRVHILDPRGDVLAFPREIAESKRVLSSSLHGIILADAYGVPNARLRFSDVVVGRHFKFLDHNAAVGKNPDFGMMVPPSGELDLGNIIFQLPKISRVEELVTSFPRSLMGDSALSLSTTGSGSGHLRRSA